MSLPSRERGLKSSHNSNISTKKNVAPLAGAWIEIEYAMLHGVSHEVAPLAGAWIEITWEIITMPFNLVAPLAGAWIEMP